MCKQIRVFAQLVCVSVQVLTPTLEGKRLGVAGKQVLSLKAWRLSAVVWSLRGSERSTSVTEKPENGFFPLESIPKADCQSRLAQ